MRKIRFALYLILLSTPAMIFPSTARTDTAWEIQQLMRFIEKSGCEFIRNDVVYTAPEARKHIEKKYDYAHRRIKTAEDFIKFTATQSSLSGKRYKVQCNDLELFSADWLKAELEQIRQGQ